MPTLSITKTYLDTQVLNEVDLDNIKNSVETFMNITKLDNVNIQTGGLATSNYADLSVTTLKLAADAVTALKLDETEAFEMLSLKLGDLGGTFSAGASGRVLVSGGLSFVNDSTGPRLSQDSADRLQIKSSIRIGDSSGPILSQVNATNDLLLANTLQLEDSNGPILAKEGTNRLLVTDDIILFDNLGPTLSKSGSSRLRVGGELEIGGGTGAILLPSSGSGPTFDVENNAGTATRTLVVSPATSPGFMMQSGTINVSGTSTATFNFGTAFSAAPHVTATAVSISDANITLNATPGTGSVVIRNHLGSAVDVHVMAFGAV